MVLIHELGHYVAGKILKFKINEFSVGFGPKILQKTKKNGEKISLRAIPLGGYCAFEGEDEEGNSTPEAFNNQKPWKRLIVLFSGAFFNFLSGIIFSFILLLSAGYDYYEVDRISTESMNYGYLQTGDVILGVDGVKIDFVNDEYLNILIEDNLMERYSTNADITTNYDHKFVKDNKTYYMQEGDINFLIRRDGKEQNVPAKINVVYSNDGKYAAYSFANTNINNGEIEISTYEYSFGEALVQAVPFTCKWAWKVLVVFGQLITGQLSIKALGGPVTTISMIANNAQISPLSLLIMMPVIAVNLAVFNLLPIPALDGFQMIFVAIEWIRKKPVKRTVINAINNIGLLVLLGFVIIVDILQFVLWFLRGFCVDRILFFCYNFNMENRLSNLDKIFNGLKFKDAEYVEKTNVCVMNFLYNPESFKPTDENKKLIMDNVKELIGDYVSFELSFKSCPLDKRAIANHTYATIINNFPAISKSFTYDDVSVDIQDLVVTVKLRLTPSSYDYASGLNRENLVADKLKESFFADFNVVFDKKADEISVNSIEKNMELMSSIKEAEEKTVYELSEIADIIGKNEYTLATDFTKIKTVVENVVICGEVTIIQRKTYKRTITKNDETKEVERTFYNFAIKNENKVLYCSIFPKQHDEMKGDLIEVGMKVCCLGSFREFNGKLNFTANSIARCVFKREEIKSAYKHVNEEYHTIFPEKYIDYEQGGLFDEEEKKFEGTYVVFDLETTGLEANKEEIIEIGACKVVDGRIDEVFSTFVKPSKAIPKEITELTGINDEMVKDAPTINYVLPDFFKFCYGSSLVAHNIAFDISFIHAISKKLSYNFNHANIDTIELAKKYLPGLKNYKLGTVVEKLNISLENAHRAVHDATATAKVFIKLMQKSID